MPCPPPKFLHCTHHPRCVLKPRCDDKACKFLGVGGRLHMVFFGPPGANAYDIYQGTVFEFSIYT